MRNTPSILELEASLGFRYSKGITATRGIRERPIIGELSLGIDAINRKYVAYTGAQAKKSKGIRRETDALFNNLGPYLWPDARESHPEWLFDPLKDADNPRYHRHQWRLYYSRPSHRKRLLKRLRFLICLKCSSFHTNHRPKHQTPVVPQSPQDLVWSESSDTEVEYEKYPVERASPDADGAEQPDDENSSIRYDWEWSTRTSSDSCQERLSPDMHQHIPPAACMVPQHVGQQSTPMGNQQSTYDMCAGDPGHGLPFVNVTGEGPHRSFSSNVDDEYRRSSTRSFEPCYHSREPAPEKRGRKRATEQLSEHPSNQAGGLNAANACEDIAAKRPRQELHPATLSASAGSVDTASQIHDTGLRILEAPPGDHIKVSPPSATSTASALAEDIQGSLRGSTGSGKLPTRGPRGQGEFPKNTAPDSGELPTTIRSGTSVKDSSLPNPMDAQVSHQSPCPPKDAIPTMSHDNGLDVTPGHYGKRSVTVPLNATSGAPASKKLIPAWESKTHGIATSSFQAQHELHLGRSTRDTPTGNRNPTADEAAEASPSRHRPAIPGNAQINTMDYNVLNRIEISLEEANEAGLLGLMALSSCNTTEKLLKIVEERVARRAKRNGKRVPEVEYIQVSHENNVDVIGRWRTFVVEGDGSENSWDIFVRRCSRQAVGQEMAVVGKVFTREGGA